MVTRLEGSWLSVMLRKDLGDSRFCCQSVKKTRTKSSLNVERRESEMYRNFAISFSPEQCSLAKSKRYTFSMRSHEQ